MEKNNAHIGVTKEKSENRFKGVNAMLMTTLSPRYIDQATIDHFVARGNRARSQAFIAAIRALFGRQPTIPAQTAVTKQGCVA